MAARTKTAPDVAMQGIKEAKHTNGSTSTPYMHQMVRSIGANADPARGIWTTEQVNQHIQVLRDQGYRLHTVDITYLRPGPSAGGQLIDEPRWDNFYILVKD